jgi:hypothetical protein
MSSKGIRSLGRLAVLAACLSPSVALAQASDEAWGTSHFKFGFGNLFAVVGADGTLVSGNGVATVDHLSIGQYEVTFTRNVERCAYVASTANAYSQPITVFTAGGHASNKGVYVETKNQGGGLTDGPFHLAVACGGSGPQFAVVGYSADLVRSSFGTTLTALGSGRYEVRFPWHFGDGFGDCAFLATVGDPANALVYNPSGVYTGTGPGFRTVYVETKNPGGGLQDGVPFHLAAVCPGPKTTVAVVPSSGILDRGSSSVNSFRASTGNFTLVTNKDISKCATVATRGSVDRAVPFSPATVEVVPGPAVNTVSLQVRALLFFGDPPAPADEAFHAAVFCK